MYQVWSKSIEGC